ncbi:hypothetical protein NFI96_014825 [Prochilodus magdalenae]|nr:hypothetical protein NFI96_014825 [Prochilodus magdalenae]
MKRRAEGENSAALSYQYTWLHNIYTPHQENQCSQKEVWKEVWECRPSDEGHPTVTADGYVDNLAAAVEAILKHRG